MIISMVRYLHNDTAFCSFDRKDSFSSGRSLDPYVKTCKMLLDLCSTVGIDSPIVKLVGMQAFRVMFAEAKVINIC